jgi:hypothetical protein
MSAGSRHAPGAATRRLAVTGTVSVLILLVSIAGALAAVRPAAPSAAPLRPARVAVVNGTARASTSDVSSAQVNWRESGWAYRTLMATDPLVLTPHDRQACPAAAAACVDLTRHLTWLQADGRVAFGPVQMEPGPPGTANATPAGTFHVAWKAGPDYISNIYHEPMPWATFFAAGGIAFHGGSLTQWSHGCVHLTVANAHYYNKHLPIGAEVVVF